MKHIFDIYESYKLIKQLTSKDRVNYIENDKGGWMPLVNGDYVVHDIKDSGWCVEISLKNLNNDKNPKKLSCQVPISDFEMSKNHDSIRWSDNKKFYEIQMK